MLVLTRKNGEAITVGDQIRIRVLDVKGNQVRLGIEAPDDLRIYREEIYLQVQEENRQASEWNLADLEKAVHQLSGHGKE